MAMAGALQNVTVPYKQGAGSIRVGTWGRQTGDGPQNDWSFALEQDQKLKKITIDYGNDVVYSLTFTTEAGGVLNTSKKFGGWNGGQTVTEIIFDSKEELVGIKGTIGTKAPYTIISSLSFVTNKATYGPFGGATDSVFTLPWDNGSLVGFYGLAGYYIDSIGVYLKDNEMSIRARSIRVGTWGRKTGGGPQNDWSFALEQGQKLKKITIDYGNDVIYSLTFTTEAGGILNTSKKFGGWNGGQTVTEIIFDSEEELVGIKGTIGTKAPYTIISSLYFVTNKVTYGPFGGTTDSVFTLPWDNGSLVGFYGLAGYYIDSIGVYLKANDWSIRVGTWGKQTGGGPQNDWSFALEQGQRLKKITIDYGNDVVYSLIFTTEAGGVLNTSKKFGGWNGGQKVTEIIFGSEEELVGIKGTIGTKATYTIISSLTFETNKVTYGPFGGTTDSVFTLPWDNGSLVGFYGLAGYYIDSIGVHLKAKEKIMSIGTWGKSPHLGSPENKWSLPLEKNHHLYSITIDHGDLIYSLIFITQYGDLTYTFDKVGGWGHTPMVDGDKISEFALDSDEEINTISGTVALSRGSNPGYIIISSISFGTNKKTHGPFGTVRGDPFTVAWEDGSFAGFFGLCGGYLDSIGVYLKDSKINPVA